MQSKGASCIIEMPKDCDLSTYRTHTHAPFTHHSYSHGSEHAGVWQEGAGL